MASSQHKLQAPKGTRDWYPPDLATRRYIESVWRKVSINHGFDEVGGPTFEHVELYTAKSGPGIVNEIFGVFSGKDEAELASLKQTGQAPYALRPEFTPTLARMYAAQAGSLPKPTKWFCMPDFYRAERPQRGRLREFQQWNVDIIGDDSPKADAEVIAVAVAGLHALGLSPNMVRVRIGDRRAVADTLIANELPPENLSAALSLIDRKDRLGTSQFGEECQKIGLNFPLFQSAMLHVQKRAQDEAASGGKFDTKYEDSGTTVTVDFEPHRALLTELHLLGVADWCDLDFISIVRGLAYYTGTVFEIHEARGEERAVAGGGRYDTLIELFGGPPTPACGFAMGDVVLTNLLRDNKLLKEPQEYLPRPDAFVIAADDEAAAEVPKIVATLRRENLHVRNSSKATRNVGKLLGDAGKARARFAVILGRELKGGMVVVKDLDGGEQREVALDDLASAVRAAVPR